MSEVDRPEPGESPRTVVDDATLERLLASEPTEAQRALHKSSISRVTIADTDPQARLEALSAEYNKALEDYRTIRAAVGEVDRIGELQTQLDEARAWARLYYFGATARMYTWTDFGLVEGEEPAWLTAPHPMEEQR